MGFVLALARSLSLPLFLSACAFFDRPPHNVRQRTSPSCACASQQSLQRRSRGEHVRRRALLWISDIEKVAVSQLRGLASPGRLGEYYICLFFLFLALLHAHNVYCHSAASSYGCDSCHRGENVHKISSSCRSVRDCLNITVACSFKPRMCVRSSSEAFASEAAVDTFSLQL